MYRVEFIGLPGSGKSTLRRKLVENFKRVDEKRYLSVEEAVLEVSKEKIDIIYRIVLNVLPRHLALRISNKLLNRNLMQFEAQNRFLAEYGKALKAFLEFSAFDRMPIDDRVVVISSFLEIGSLYKCIDGRLSRETVVFFEEGFIQKSFMFISPLEDDCSDKTQSYDYLNNVPLPDLIVYVKAGISSCHKRMVARPEGLTKRLRKVDEKGIIKFLETADVHLRDISSWLKENKEINLVEFNNSGTFSNATDVELKIKALYGAR